MPPTKFLTLLNFDFLHGRPEWNGKWINYDEIAPHVWTCIGKCWKGVGIRTCRVILTFHLQHWPWRQSWQLIFQGMRKSCHQLIILQDRLLTLRDSCSFTQTHTSQGRSHGIKWPELERVWIAVELLTWWSLPEWCPSMLLSWTAAHGSPKFLLFPNAALKNVQTMLQDVGSILQQSFRSKSK